MIESCAVLTGTIVAYDNGTPFTWVPTRDPEKFPVCPDCQAIVDYRSVD